jgi:3'-phosphoadenosine 5'-phosphosulfate sulfotransferase (PAPS reductase)/FAD synthetase
VKWQTVLDKLAGRTIVASISGGKDSAAMSLFLLERGLAHRRVFLDTGWEHPETYAYIRGALSAKIGPIEEVRGPETFEQLVRRKGVFPGRQSRFCTQYLKFEPIKRYLAALMDTGVEVINAVGVRRAESAARADVAEWEWSKDLDCEIWRPIYNWTESRVIFTHKRHGLSPNPLYLRGASRVGCWPCIHARKAELRLVADTDPERIARIREIEYALTERAGAQRTMFPAALGRKGAWPIDRVAEWSRTKRGGREFEPFVDTREGCMRWGLCETAGGDP